MGRKDNDAHASHGIGKVIISILSHLSPLILLTFLIFSCTTIDCPVQNLVYTVYSVYNFDEQRSDTLPDTLWVWTRRRDGTDTLLLNRGVNQTLFNLHISYQHPEDTLIFYIADTAGVRTLDTVWVKKEDYPHFESVDCNQSFFHQLTAVRSTHNGIDTIAINRSTVDYDPSTPHFNISFKDRR